MLFCIHKQILEQSGIMIGIFVLAFSIDILVPTMNIVKKSVKYLNEEQKQKKNKRCITLHEKKLVLVHVLYTACN